MQLAAILMGVPRCWSFPHKILKTTTSPPTPQDDVTPWMPRSLAYSLRHTLYFFLLLSKVKIEGILDHCRGKAEAKSGLASVTQLFSSACAWWWVGRWKRAGAVLHGPCVASAPCSCTQKSPEYIPRIKSPETEAFSVFWATSLNMT